MSDTLPAGFSRAWAALADHGYAVTSTGEIGLPEKICENFARTYFTQAVLRHDEGDWPADRQRARDVIRYQWLGDQLKLQEHDTITITDRADIPGKRDHARIKLLADPQAEDLVRALLRLVPATRRQPDGTFGINLFRTFTNVVTKPHHDNEEFIVLSVLDRIGSGAETYLYRPGDVLETGETLAGPVFRTQLSPGDILIFEDGRYKHGTTPLMAPPGGTAQRDALVCTIDHRWTYLDPASQPGRAAEHRQPDVLLNA